jgi:hypothetical protein
MARYFHLAHNGTTLMWSVLKSVNLVPLLSRGVVQNVVASAIGFEVGVSPVVWS